MNLSSNISDRIKDSSLDTKRLLELIKAGGGPTILQIAAFQESLWNDAFDYERSSDTEAPRCTRQESDERWMSIIYLFFDLIEHRDEREQDYIRLTSQDGIFCPSATGTGNSLPSYISFSASLSSSLPFFLFSLPPYLPSCSLSQIAFKCAVYVDLFLRDTFGYSRSNTAACRCRYHIVGESQKVGSWYAKDLCSEYAWTCRSSA